MSQNKYSSQFIEVCIDKAPKEIQNEIIEEFCNSAYLHQVISSNFGNYVLQKSLKTYCKSEKLKYQLLEHIIHSLRNVNEYKIQQKWGNDILMQLIESLENYNEKERLVRMLKERMVEIDGKHKKYIEQQMLKMQKSSEQSKSSYRKQSNQFSQKSQNKKGGNKGGGNKSGNSNESQDDDQQ